MPSTMEVRSFGSMRIQSSSNHRLTASNWATLFASPVVVGASYARYVMPACVRVSSTSGDQSVHVSCPLSSGYHDQVGELRRHQVFPLVDGEASMSGGEPPLPFRDHGAELVRVDDVLVDLEERDVVVEDLMQEDHEFDEVRAGLLPKGLLPFAEEIRHQRGDAVGQGIRVEVVVQRVVAVAGVETDFDVIVAATVVARGGDGRADRSRPSLPGPGRRPSARDRWRDTRTAARRTDRDRRRSCPCRSRR